MYINSSFKILYCFLLISAVLLGCEKEEMQSVKNSKSYTISSAKTGDDYKLQILYPPHFDSTIAYPTFYLLDGDWLFNEMATVVQKKFAEEVILIGIGYKNEINRNKDYSYPSNSTLKNSGGGIKYMQFLQEELMEFIKKDLSIQSSKTTLCGHSLGGYLALLQLFQTNPPNPFDHIIAASPSLYWADAYLLKLENEYHKNSDSLSATLYTTIGDLEGITMNTLFDAFNKQVKSRNYIGLSFEHKRYHQTSHNNNPIQSFEDGIALILNQ